MEEAMQLNNVPINKLLFIQDAQLTEEELKLKKNNKMKDTVETSQCVKCNKVIHPNQIMFQCEICSKKYHQDCFKWDTVQIFNRYFYLRYLSRESKLINFLCYI